MASALILGAGAIGRGFLPWVLEGFDIDFCDAAPGLIDEITSRGSYRSYMSVGGVLVERVVRPRVAKVDLSDLDLAGYDAAFVAVGPRNITTLPGAVSGITCPLFSLENDPSTVGLLAKHYGLSRVYFGVPDVITSSTASPDHLAADPLALHTEDGVLYLEDSHDTSVDLKGNLGKVQWTKPDQLRCEWDAKLYLHNTPHCVAAYLGYLAGCKYVHEGFKNDFIRRTVEGVIEEMLLSLKISTTYDHNFLEDYALKELRRFSNDQLFDPISRVAREPLRKLAPAGRLTGALRMSMLSGVAPVNLMIGIAAALSYQETRDDDFSYIRLFDDFGLSAFLKFHLSISPDSLESQYMIAKLDSARRLLVRNLPWTP